MKPPAFLPRRQRGYILALNIAVLAVMLVGATYMGQRLHLALRLARMEEQRVTTELAMRSARAEVLYLLATVQRSRFGLGILQGRAVALDGRYYRMGQDMVVSLQDARGLISVNAVRLSTDYGRERIERLLSTYGLDAPSQSRLTDKLLDYRDDDDFRRINGAEKEEYALEKQADTIRNADLLAPAELSRVHEWGQTAALWQQDPISEHVNTLNVSLFNPNNADWRALVAATGTSEELARSLVKSRQAGAIADITPLIYTGDIYNPFGQGGAVSFFPSETIVVTLGRIGTPFAVRMAVKHTHALSTTPWRILYSYKTTLPEDLKSADKLPELPQASELRDFSAPYQLELPF